MDLQAVTIVLLLLAILMLAWVIGTALKIQRDLEPLVSSPLARTLAGVGT